MVALEVAHKVRNVAGVVVPDRQKPGEKNIVGRWIAQRAQAPPPPGKYGRNRRVNCARHFGQMRARKWCSPSWNGSGDRLMNVLPQWYIRGMKIKTSVTLSKEVVALIDKHAEGETNRSAFIELAVRTYLRILQRRERDQRDLRTINRLSEKLNKEAEDVLDYQRELGR